MGDSGVALKKILLGIGIGLATSGIGISLVAARYIPVIVPGTRVGPVAVGGLTHEEAAKRIRVWWESEKIREVSLRLPGTAGKTLLLKANKLGFRLDDLASVKDLPMQEFTDAAQAAVGLADQTVKKFEIKWAILPGKPFEAMIDFVEDNVGGVSAARATWNGTSVSVTPERAGATLNVEEFQAQAPRLLAQGHDELVLPTIEAPKRVTDEALAQITEIVGEFTTKFSAGNRNRSDNLRIAATSLDGTILMPGEEFSFNGVLGRRTKQLGYKEAGVYVNGRHDTGIGGGICQVSTTLYNAVLFADLKVTKRTNHSMPVPYVPLGRDATVSYGALDFKFANSLETPVAISASYNPGKLTFRILGTKDEGVSVKMISSAAKSWAAAAKTITDPRLAPGAKKVIEKGSIGRSVKTYRVVYKNGVEARRDDLGSSIYRAFPRVIAVGKPATATPPAP